MKYITGTLISYYFFCTRRMWLHANDIRFESNSEDVAMGLLISENSYPQRSEHYTEIEMDGIKIDFYDPKRKIIHEIKKSDSHEEAHEWQVKYYMYVMKKNGISDVKGILEYPKLRETRTVELTSADEEKIEVIRDEIGEIIQSETCPNKKSISKCKNCSYSDFCWSGEEN